MSYEKARLEFTTEYHKCSLKREKVWIPFLCLNEMYTTNQKYIKNTKPTIITTTPVIKKLKFVWNKIISPYLTIMDLLVQVSSRTEHFVVMSVLCQLSVHMNRNSFRRLLRFTGEFNFIDWAEVYEHFRSPRWKEILIRRLVKWKWYSIWTFEFPIIKYHILNAGT